jgi:hypothetical protein
MNPPNSIMRIGSDSSEVLNVCEVKNNDVWANLVQLHEFFDLLRPNFRAGGSFHLKNGPAVKYLFLQAPKKNSLSDVGQLLSPQE